MGHGSLGISAAQNADLTFQGSEMAGFASNDANGCYYAERVQTSAARMAGSVQFLFVPTIVRNVRRIPRRLRQIQLCVHNSLRIGPAEMEFAQGCESSRR